ncbi:MAG TPA: M15 family metallopeptidase [Nocardioides sp.]|nr:M15 family metallopeptidase [Nocardioides sp.]
MTRTRILAAAVLASLVAPLGVAGATESPSTDPSPSPSNQAPVAVDDTAQVTAGSAVTIPVLANDEDDQVTCTATAPCLRVESVEPAGGRATTDGTTVTFTTGAADAGTYTFNYVVGDGALTDVGTVVVTVTAPPPPPSGGRSVSIAMADSPVALKRYTVSGRTQPLRAGRAVVRVERQVADGWTLLAKDRTDDRGRYAVPFRTSRPGPVTLRATAVWSSGPSARSGSLTRNVRAVANPAVSGPLTARQVPYSWRRGCPVAPSGLRRITISRIDYSGLVARGSIVVRAREVGAIVKVLTAAIDARFPIRMMKPTDYFYAGGRRTPTESDKASMRAGNTSAFNCRPVVGNPYRVSQHSYGNAIDMNTIENPYVTGSQVYPPGSGEYLDRSPYRRGMILPDGVVASRMRSLGWLWGARWSNPDYQHFSSNGG